MAIRSAGERLLSCGRVIVATAYAPLMEIPFTRHALPIDRRSMSVIEDIARADAQRVAEEGAEIARDAGFEAESLAPEGSPIWHALVESRTIAMPISSSWARVGSPRYGGP
ncbi:MAG TPA: hypothetical protein VGC32_13610 [Solirubrobacterales bacterium]